MVHLLKTIDVSNIFPHYSIAAAKVVLDNCVIRNDAKRSSPEYTVLFKYEFIEEDFLEQNRPLNLFDHALKGATKVLPDSMTSRRATPRRRQAATRSINDVQSETTAGQANRGFRRKCMEILRPTKRTKHTMQLMVEHNHEDLLNHQLTNSLITYKWVRMSFVFFGHLFLYALFVSLFTAFLVLTKPPFALAGGSTNNLDDVCQAMEKDGNVAYDLTIGVPKYGVIVFCSVRLLLELLQFFSFLLNYFTPENLIENATFILALLTTIDTNGCMRATGLRTNWQWITGSIGIIVAWFNMMLFVRKGPVLGVYVIMFFKVLGTFAVFICVFSPFIFGFVLALHFLLKNQFSFSSVKNSIITTLTMLTGELNVGSVVIAGFNTTTYDETVFYADTTYVVFGLSIVLLAIVLMNLFVGLAVDDIKEIQRKATVESLGMKPQRDPSLNQTCADKIDMIMSTEYSLGKLAHFLKSPREYKYRPNVIDGLLTWYFNSKFEESMLAINAVASSPVDQIDEVEDTDGTGQSLQQQVLDIGTQVVHIARLVNRLVDHSNETHSDPERQPGNAIRRLYGLGGGSVEKQTLRVMNTVETPDVLQRLDVPDDIDAEPFLDRFGDE